MITWLRRMQEITPNITLFGSVWSPPQWMKTVGSNALQPQYLQAWVRYVLLYLTSYSSLGVDIAAITIQVCQAFSFATSCLLAASLPTLASRTNLFTAATLPGPCTWTPPPNRLSRALFPPQSPPLIHLRTSRYCTLLSCGRTITTPTCRSIPPPSFHPQPTASPQSLGTATLLTAQAGASSTISTTTILGSLRL